MGKLALSVAVGDYDRTRPLIDGRVQIDGVDPVIMTLSPEEIFFRAFRDAPFDICELSLSSFTVKTAAGDCPYVGVPAFVSRAFRHTSIYVAGPHQAAAGPFRQADRRRRIPAHGQCLGARPAGRAWRVAVGRRVGARRAGGAGSPGEGGGQPAVRHPPRSST